MRCLDNTHAGVGPRALLQGPTTLKVEEPSNHLMLRWLKTVVVSDEEKAPLRCQVGIRKASESDSLLTCRNLETTSKPGCQCDPEMSLCGVIAS